MHKRYHFWQLFFALLGDGASIDLNSQDKRFQASLWPQLMKLVCQLTNEKRMKLSSLSSLSLGAQRRRKCSGWGRMRIRIQMPASNGRLSFSMFSHFSYSFRLRYSKGASQSLQMNMILEGLSFSLSSPDNRQHYRARSIGPRSLLAAVEGVSLAEDLQRKAAELTWKL